MVDRIPESFNFEDRKEGTVFYKDIPEVIQGSIEINDVVAEIQSQVNHAAEIKDDRLYALVADLLVESAIDNYLSQVMPKYKQELFGKRDFTFSLKIAVAKELRFSPTKFFNAADYIRTVRNEFAHNLRVKTFEDLKPTLIAKIDSVLNACLEKKPTQDSFRAKYNLLTVTTVFGLIFHSRYVRLLNLFLRDDEFYDIFSAYIDRKRAKK